MKFGRKKGSRGVSLRELSYAVFLCELLAQKYKVQAAVDTVQNIHPTSSYVVFLCERLPQKYEVQAAVDKIIHPFQQYRKKKKMIQLRPEKVRSANSAAQDQFFLHGQQGSGCRVGRLSKFLEGFRVRHVHTE